MRIMYTHQTQFRRIYPRGLQVDICLFWKKKKNNNTLFVFVETHYETRNMNFIFSLNGI